MHFAVHLLSYHLLFTIYVNFSKSIKRRALNVWVVKHSLRRTNTPVCVVMLQKCIAWPKKIVCNKVDKKYKLCYHHYCSWYTCNYLAEKGSLACLIWSEVMEQQSIYRRISLVKKVIRWCHRAICISTLFVSLFPNTLNRIELNRTEWIRVKKHCQLIYFSKKHVLTPQTFSIFIKTQTKHWDFFTKYYHFYYKCQKGKWVLTAEPNVQCVVLDMIQLL